MENERQYKDLVENANDLIQSVSPDGKLLYVNRAWRETLGYSREEINRLTLFGIIHPDSQAHCQEIFQRVVSGGKVERVEATFLTKDGKEVHVEGSANCRFKKGKPIATRGIFRNITERKKVEEELKNSEKRLKILFEYAPDAYYLNDMKGKFTDGNKAAEEITGYRREELIGKSFLKLNLLPKAQILKAVKLLTKNAMGKSTGPDEFILNRKDGSKINVEITTHPVKIKRKKLVLGIARDITDRKKAEEKIKASLKEKEVMLKEIHHRVKNNLQTISSLLNISSRNIKDQQALSTLEESQNRIKSMAIIHNKLYQSKDLSSINFKDYIQSLVSELFESHRVNSKLIKSKINVDNVYLDINTAIPCGMIINELASNALKHAFPHGKKGEITFDLHTDKKNKFILIVSDNGIGFPKDLDFRKTESLGMQLVCVLTDQLGGAIDLDRKGETKFTIKFQKIKKSQRL